MEWVETTGKTVEEAKERALDQLGVHVEDAEFDIIEEPKAGLFGRLRGEARVRARVRPTPVRQKVDRRDRKRSERKVEKSTKPAKTEKSAKPEKSAKSTRTPKAEKADKPEKADKIDKADKAVKSDKTEKPKQTKTPKTDKSDRGSKVSTANQRAGRPPKAAPDEHSEEQTVDAHHVGEEATRFMTGLIEAFGAEGTVELVEDGDDLEVRVHGKELGLLVGPRGSTLQAVQDIARVASQRRLGDHDTRLRIDIAGYRERRREALGRFAVQMADEVKASGVARVLEPMSSADRKIIHDTLAEDDGVATRSEGDDPYRRVIIAPANG